MWPPVRPRPGRPAPTLVHTEMAVWSSRVGLQKLQLCKNAAIRSSENPIMHISPRHELLSIVEPERMNRPILGP